MDGDRTDRALSRIDTALRRIEAAAERLDKDSAALSVRNTELRGAVEQAIARIDGLLAAGPAS